MAEITAFDRLQDLANAIREKTEITSPLTLEGMAQAVRQMDGGANAVNYRVVSTRPDRPVENTIHVDTHVPITKYAFAVKNPWITKVDTELAADLTRAPGYLSTSNTISTQDSTKKEIYLEEYIEVRHGNNYNWSYTLPESKSMWLAIIECDNSKTMLGSRKLLVDNVTATEQQGVYTPSAANVTCVRLSWRTYGLEDQVSFVGPVDYTNPEEADGAVWFRTSYYSYSDFNAQAKNQLQVYPVQAKQFYEGRWHEMDCYSYENENWHHWVPYGSLYWFGNDCVEESGGWIGRGRARNSEATSYKYAPIVTNTGDYLLITHNPGAETQAIGLAETKVLQDLTDVAMIAVDCEGEVYNSGVRVTLCAIEANAYLDNSVSNLVLLYPTTNTSIPQTLPRDTVYIDVSSLTGQYNVAFKYSDTWSDGLGSFNLKVYSIKKIYNDEVA